MKELSDLEIALCGLGSIRAHIIVEGEKADILYIHKIAYTTYMAIAPRTEKAREKMEKARSLFRRTKVGTEMTGVLE